MVRPSGVHRVEHLDAQRSAVSDEQMAVVGAAVLAHVVHPVLHAAVARDHELRRGEGQIGRHVRLVRPGRARSGHLNGRVCVCVCARACVCTYLNGRVGDLGCILASLQGLGLRVTGYG